MLEVSRDVFFCAIGGPENIHPRSERDCSIWEIVHTRQIVGKSEPGYASPNGTPARYWIVPYFLEKAKHRIPDGGEHG